MHTSLRLSSADREIVLTQVQNVISASHGSREDWAYTRPTLLTQRLVNENNFPVKINFNQYGYQRLGNKYASNPKVNVTDETNRTLTSIAAVDNNNNATFDINCVGNNSISHKIDNNENNIKTNEYDNLECKLKFSSNWVNAGLLGNDGRKYNCCGRVIPILTQLYKLQSLLREVDPANKTTCEHFTATNMHTISQTSKAIRKETDYLSICEYDILSVFCAACLDDEVSETVSSVALNALITFIEHPCSFLSFDGLELCVWTAMTCKSEITDIAAHEVFVSRILKLYKSVITHQQQDNNNDEDDVGTQRGFLSEILYINIIRRILSVILRPYLSPLLRQTAENDLCTIVRLLFEQTNGTKETLQNTINNNNNNNKIVIGASIIRLASALIRGDVKTANDDVKICSKLSLIKTTDMSPQNKLNRFHFYEETANGNMKWPSACIVCEDLLAARMEGLSLAQHILLELQRLWPIDLLHTELVETLQHNLCRSLLISAVSLKDKSEHILFAQVLRTMQIVIGYARSALVPQIYAFIQTVHIQPLIRITQTLALHEMYQTDRDELQHTIKQFAHLAVQFPIQERTCYSNGAKASLRSDNDNNNNMGSDNIDSNAAYRLDQSGNCYDVHMTRGANSKQVLLAEEEHTNNISSNNELHSAAPVVLRSDYNIPLSACTEPGSPLMCSSPTYVTRNNMNLEFNSGSITNASKIATINSNSHNNININSNNNYSSSNKGSSNSSNSNINIINQYNSYSISVKSGEELERMRAQREVLLESLANLCSDASFLEWCFVHYDLSWRYSSILPQLWSLLSVIAFGNKVIMSTAINGLMDTKIRLYRCNEHKLEQECQIVNNDIKNNIINNNNNNSNVNDHFWNSVNNDKDNINARKYACNKTITLPMEVEKVFASAKCKRMHGVRMAMYNYTREEDKIEFNNSIRHEGSIYEEKDSKKVISDFDDDDDDEHDKNNDAKVNYCTCEIVERQNITPIQTMALEILILLQKSIYNVVNEPFLKRSISTIADHVQNELTNTFITTTTNIHVEETIERMKMQKEEVAQFAARFQQSAEDNGIPFLLRYSHRVQCMAGESEDNALHRCEQEYQSQLLLLEPAGAREVGMCLFRLSGVLNKRILGEFIGELGKESELEEHKELIASETTNAADVSSINKDEHGKEGKTNANIINNNDEDDNNTNAAFPATISTTTTTSATVTTSDVMTTPEYGSKLYHQQLLLGFMEQFRFSGKPLLTAIRELVYKVCLPGESQKIDRVMEAAAQQWYAANHNESKEINPFKSEEGAFILSFALIMLNTDLHSGKLRQCMTQNEFTRMNRGIDAGTDVPESYLNELYNDVKEHEIVMADMSERSFDNDVTWNLQMKMSEMSATNNNSNNININDNKYYQRYYNNKLVLHQMLLSDISSYSLPVYMYMYHVSSQRLTDIPARGASLTEALERVAEEMPHVYKTFECALNGLVMLIKSTSTCTDRQSMSQNVISMTEYHKNEAIAEAALRLLLSNTTIDLSKIDRAIKLIYESIPTILTIRTILELIPHLSSNWPSTWKLLASLVNALYLTGVLTLTNEDSIANAECKLNDSVSSEYTATSAFSTSLSINNFELMLCNPHLSRLTLPLLNKNIFYESRKANKECERTNSSHTNKHTDIKNNAENSNHNNSHNTLVCAGKEKKDLSDEEHNKQNAVINVSRNTTTSSQNKLHNREAVKQVHVLEKQMRNNNKVSCNTKNDVYGNNISSDNSNNKNKKTSSSGSSSGGGGGWLSSLWSNVTAAAAAAASESQRKQEAVLLEAEERTEQALPHIKELIVTITSTQQQRQHIIEYQELFIHALCEEAQMKSKTSTEAVHLSFKLSLLCAIMCALLENSDTDCNINNNNNNSDNDNNGIDEEIVFEQECTKSNRSETLLTLVEEVYNTIARSCEMVFEVLQTPLEHSREAATSKVIISLDAHRRWSEVALRITHCILVLAYSLTCQITYHGTLQYTEKLVTMLLRYTKIPSLTPLLLPRLLSFLQNWTKQMQYHELKGHESIYEANREHKAHEMILISSSWNAIIKFTTELCMCVYSSHSNMNSISPHVLRTLESLLLSLTKVTCANDVDCATRIIRAALYIGLVIHPTHLYGTSHKEANPNEISVKTAHVYSNNDEGDENVHADKNASQHTEQRSNTPLENACTIIVECLEKFTYNDAKNDNVTIIINDDNIVNKNDKLTNFTHLYLLALDALAKLVLRTSNSPTCQPLLFLQRVLLDARRMPLPTITLSKVYNDILIPITKYTCVSTKMWECISSPRSEGKPWKKEVLLENERHEGNLLVHHYHHKQHQHHREQEQQMGEEYSLHKEVEEHNSNISENAENTTIEDNKPMISNDNGKPKRSNAAHSVFFSLFQAFAPAPQPSSTSVKLTTEKVEENNKSTPVTKITVNNSNDNVDSDININNDNNTKINDNLSKSLNEKADDTRITLEDESNVLQKNAGIADENERYEFMKAFNCISPIAKYSKMVCANADVQCRIVNLLPKLFLHHFTVLITTEPEILLTLWEQILTVLCMVYESHDCHSNITNNNAKVINSNKLHYLAAHTENTSNQTHTSVTEEEEQEYGNEDNKDEVENNVLVCEAVEEVVKNAIYVITAALPSLPSNSLSNSQNDECNIAHIHAIIEQFYFIARQLLTSFQFASPLLAHFELLHSSFPRDVTLSHSCDCDAQLHKAIDSNEETNNLDENGKESKIANNNANITENIENVQNN